MSGALDAVGRVVLLVLSGIATLALIGAIAQVSDIDPGAPPPGEVARIEPADPRAPPPAGTIAGSPAPSGVGAPSPAADSRVDAEAVRWLKALAYAAMALAGFAAAALIVLLRITATLARIAER